MLNRRTGRRQTGFTLVELLVVIGIISVLISLLLPSLSKAQKQAKSLACKSNLKQCGAFMLMYMNDNKGFVFPPDMGTNLTPDKRWPTLVFKPAIPNPTVMRCPEDPDMGPNDLVPEDKHSYILNNHIVYDGITYTHNQGVPTTDIVILGEKKPTFRDYYMEVQNANSASASSQFDQQIDLQRHGKYHGCNYLFLDLHVDQELAAAKPNEEDPWDIVVKGH